MSTPVRFLTLLFATLQFVLPAAVSVADGAAAAGGRNSATHVESKGDRDCKPPHTADCAMCRFLTAVHSQPGASASIAIVTTGTPTPATPFAFCEAVARHGFNSRAPPTLLD